MQLDAFAASRSASRTSGVVSRVSARSVGASTTQSQSGEAAWTRAIATLAATHAEGRLAPRRRAVRTMEDVAADMVSLYRSVLASA